MNKEFEKIIEELNDIRVKPLEIMKELIIISKK